MLELGSNASRSFRLVTILLICSAAFMMLALTLPRMVLFTYRPEDHASIHLLLELVSISVSVMVVTVTWISKNKQPKWQPQILIFGFTLIAGLDLLHALTFKGMPSLINNSNSDESIFFWLAGRVATLAVIIILGLKIKIRGSKIISFFSALIVLAIAFYIGTFHLNYFPALFLPGKGVTQFKINAEYGIFVANMLASIWLFLLWNKSKNEKNLWLASACVMTGLSELAFTNYITSSDFINVFGHAYKAIAYLIIFRAIAYSSIQEPYEILEKTNATIKRKEQEFKNLLDSLPVDVVQINPDYSIRYCNSRFSSHIGKQTDLLQGKLWSEINTPGWSGNKLLSFDAPFRGHRSTFEFTDNDREPPQYYSAIAIPELDIESGKNGVLAIFVNTTEQEMIRRQLGETKKENMDLKSALDAHAIVATTDAKGVITSINKKFCQISKYSPEELIGKTHRVINSGYHPKSFFNDLWKTISSGKVWTGEICNRAKDGSIYWVVTTIVPFFSATSLGKSAKPDRYLAIRADITEQKRAQQEAQKMAFYDVLTGLPNRRFMVERLDIAIANTSRNQNFCSLMLLDIDHFKYVNDTYGHDQGDELLRQVAARLNGCAHKTDTIARMGGDEFVVIFADLGTDRANALVRSNDLAEKIRETLAEPYHLKDITVFSSSSIGCVMFHDESLSGDETLKRADIALYSAKSLGRNRVQYFDTSMQTEIMEYSQIVLDLRTARSKNELILFYQPIVDLNQEITGYEALIRWNHSKKGLISPAAFIPVAEKSGLIISIGEWVIREACRKLSVWANEPEKKNLTISVNVSAYQLNEADFVSKAISNIEQFLVRPTHLKIEITESMLQRDIHTTISKLNELKKLGVRFSLDDFGTGYSSLSYLKKLPLDFLKIDRSFVRDIMIDQEDAAIAETILLLAQTLGMKVIAEGVETLDQYHFLKTRGCDYFQGYLFGKPAPLDD
ncbi:MAG: hypothetical protein B7X44_02695 [Halothiobacillus sp. 15-55-196]|nr:MAG: hypothetical protein B7X44_02695 [Halothiobacillus sp. 15-55-196]